jgi:glycosyltransferase involved in cell wall biosynthesis
MDGLPTVLLESMALGTPCVSTGVTGIPEVVIDGETGLLVPQHAPEKLADACQQLLDDAALRVRLARRARQLIDDEFDVARNTARLRDVFARASVSARPSVVDALEPAIAAEPVEAA